MANVNIRGLSDATKKALRIRASRSALIDKYFGKKHGVELDLPKRSTTRERVDYT